MAQALQADEYGEVGERGLEDRHGAESEDDRKVSDEHPALGALGVRCVQSTLDAGACRLAAVPGVDHVQISFDLYKL